MPEKGLRGIWWLSFQPCVFLSSYLQPFDSALSGGSVPATLYQYCSFWCVLLGVTPISQMLNGIMGICPTSFSTRSGQNLTRHILLALLVHAYLHCRSLPLKCTAALALPNFAGSCLIPSKKGIADYFCSLTSMSLSCSLCLTNVVGMLVARVLAKAESWKRVLETI